MITITPSLEAIAEQRNTNLESIVERGRREIALRERRARARAEREAEEELDRVERAVEQLLGPDYCSNLPGCQLVTSPTWSGGRLEFFYRNRRYALAITSQYHPGLLVRLDLRDDDDRDPHAVRPDWGFDSAQNWVELGAALADLHDRPDLPISTVVSAPLPFEPTPPTVAERLLALIEEIVEERIDHGRAEA